MKLILYVLDFILDVSSEAIPGQLTRKCISAANQQHWSADKVTRFKRLVALAARDAHADGSAVSGVNNKRDLNETAPIHQKSGEQMQTILKTLFVGAIIAIGTGTAVAADAVVGTWKLNLAKSTFSPGPAPKSQTRTYAESAQGTTVTVKTTAADGKESTTNITFKEDGKSYPVSGNADFDMVSVKRVDALTVHSTQTKAGAAVGTGVRTVSKDGKTLTFTQKSTNADGVKHDDVSVYDKQ
jgi:hypothetical protein